MTSPRRLLGNVSAICALGAAAAFALPATASADVNSDPCGSPPLSQPFAQWGDQNAYTLVPEADFEGSMDGWNLQGRAQQVSGSETYGATGSVGNYAVSLSGGDTAASPSMCVDAAYPDFRFFARANGANTSVQAWVLYTVGGVQVKVPVGMFRPGTSWQPSPPMATGSAIAAARNGGTAQLTLQFKVTGGTAQIDDIYIDPWGACC